MLNIKGLSFANKTALHNPIQIFLYLIAYPISLIFKKLGITPNYVTLLSFILAIAAFVSLVTNNLKLFFIFWTISYWLDYSDGTLARMTKKIGTKALRYDHVSDQVKIMLVFLGFGIYYQNITIWILIFLSSTLFLFYSLLNHEMSSIKKLIEMVNQDSNPSKDKTTSVSNLRLLKRNIIDKSIIGKCAFSCIYGTFFIINGHSLLIFYIIPIGFNYAFYSLLYFILICLAHSLPRLVFLSKSDRI